MSRIDSTPRFHVDLAVTSADELFARLQLENQDTQAETALESRQLNRELRTSAQQERIHEMESAAEAQYIGALVSSIASATAAVCSAASAVSSLVNAPQGLSQTPSEKTPASNHSQWGSTVEKAGGMLDAGGKIAAAVFQHDSALHNTRATEAEGAADSAADAMQSDRDMLDSVRQSKQRLLDALREVQSERARALAATRG